MLQFFHKYQRSVIVYIFMGVILLSMAFFGIDMFNAQPNQYALKINDREISFAEVTERRRLFENQLRQQFGDAFDTLWEFLARDLNQRVVDSFIEEQMFEKVASQQNLVASNAEVRDILLGLFQGQFSAATYQAYLRQQQVTAQQFEAQIAQQARRQQLVNILDDFGRASNYEALKTGQRQESKLDLQYVKYNPKNLIESLPAPDKKTLQEYYETNLNEYELEPRVMYSAIIVSPEDVLNEISLDQEDIELYYSEHLSDYQRPARANVAHIQINYGADSSPEAMSSVKEKAEEIKDRAQRGEDFNSLVAQYSDDIPSKLINGSIGWIEEGQRDDAIAKAALGLKAAGITELVSTDYGFHIVKVIDYQEVSNKELAEVADDILKKLKEIEAPAFALVKAEDLLERFKQSSLSLADFSKAENLKLISSSDFLTADEDIDPAYLGLTQQILNNSSEAKQLVELGNSNLVIEIGEFKDTELPSFDRIIDKVKSDWLEIKAKELAREKASDLLAQAKQNNKPLSELAEELNLELATISSASLSDSAEAILKNNEIKRLAFRMGSPGIVGDRVFEAENEFVVLEVTKLEKPEASNLSKPLAEYRDSVKQNNTQAVKTSLLKALQAQSTIDVAPAMLSN